MELPNHYFEKVCRSCLKPDSNLKCILLLKISEEKQIHLSDFIRRMTSLKISKLDNLPDSICPPCIEAFTKAYQLAEMFIESDLKLKEQYANKSVVNLTEEHEEIKFQLRKTKDSDITELKNVRLPKHNLLFNALQSNPSNDTLNEDENFERHRSMRMLYEEQGRSLKDEEEREKIEENKQYTTEIVQEEQKKPTESLETSEINLLYEQYDCDETKEDDSEYTESISVIVESTPKPKRRKYKEKVYKCSRCPESFCTSKEKKRHERSCDPNKPFKCEHCPKSFNNEVALKTHILKHSEKDEKRYICDVCGQKFKHEHLLKMHSYKHSNEKPFPCTKCSKGCITAESLRRHMKVHDETYEKKMHTCLQCNKEFPYKSFLAEHMKTHTGERPFLCSLCGKGFRQSGALEYHLRTHSGERPYDCTVCQKKFTSSGVLKVHMRSHTDERPYVCDTCGMAFRQSTDMKTHYRNIHRGDKPILCTLCGKRMSSTGQLTVHLRSHTGEKPFACNRCGKAFATRTTLVKHERIHTGLRPYRCEICGKAFNQSSTLNTHMRIHKGKNKENVRGTKINLSEISDSNCLILEINNTIPPQVVQVEQIAVTSTEQVVLLPTPVPLLQNL